MLEEEEEDEDEESTDGARSDGYRTPSPGIAPTPPTWRRKDLKEEEDQISVL